MRTPVSISPPPRKKGSPARTAHSKRLTSDDAAVRAEAGRAWSRWEMATSRLHVNKDYLDRADDAEFADAFARIEVRSPPLLPLSEPSQLTVRAVGAGALLRQRRLLRARRVPARARADRPDPAHPVRDRAGRVRHGVPAQDGVGLAQGVARGQVCASAAPPALSSASKLLLLSRSFATASINTQCRSAVPPRADTSAFSLTPGNARTQIVVPAAGHSAMEEGTERALIEATDEFAKLP